MAKLTIQKPKPMKKNIYEIEVKFMHGDADGYTKEFVRIPSDKVNLVEEVLDALHKLENTSRREYYDQVEYKIWFMDSYYGALPDGTPAYDKNWPAEATYERCQEAANYSFSWPNDMKNYDGIDAKLEEFKTFYYDENGIKHSVKVEF